MDGGSGIPGSLTGKAVGKRIGTGRSYGSAGDGLAQTGFWGAGEYGNRHLGIDQM